jgi:hypothetical protein
VLTRPSIDISVLYYTIKLAEAFQFDEKIGKNIPYRNWVHP